MDYYNKYLKYKEKYINLLKGGTVPHIDDDLLPFENSDINIIYQVRFILKNNDNPENNYLLNENYQLEKIRIPINKPLLNIPNLSMLANLNVKLGSDNIPFHIGSLQFNFNIIIGIINYIDYYNNILQQKGIKISNKIKDFKKYISSKIFNVDIRNNLFLGITNKNSILNCFSFFNKLHEFLSYILINEYDQQKFNKLFPNLENIKDFYNIYSFYYTEKNKECTIKKYKELQEDTFYKHIKEFKDFIKNCNIIDKHINFKSMFGISLINLILINWIYLRFLRTNLVVGSLSSNLYPINKLNFLENIFQMNEEKIYCFEKEQKELNDEEDINKLLLQKISVPIVPYGQSTYKGNSFPNCVENTILQLLKILAWDEENYKYNIDLLPEGIGKKFKNIIERINSEPLNIETKEIMDDFVKLISGGKNTDHNLRFIDYRNNNEYNIKSYIENVGNILNYVFNGKTIEGGINDYSKIFDEINDNTDKYTLHQNDNKIIINKNDFSINIIIDNGHAFIDNKINSIYEYINNYNFLSIIYSFNFTKDDTINFGKKFNDFCKKQNKEFNNYLTNKIINIQKISLCEYNSKDEAGRSCLHISCIVGSLEQLQQYIIHNYASINITDNQGSTPLLIASYYGNIDCVDLLIKNGADINLSNIINNTPLTLASTMGHIDCVKLLIENGADVNHKTNRGDTSILLASIMNHIECIKLLIKEGADVNNSGYYGITPIIAASKNGFIECIKILIKNGADVNCRDNSRMSPLRYASSGGHSECVKYLIEKGARW